MAQLIDQCPVRWQAIHHGLNIAIQCDQQKISYLQLDHILSQLATQLATQCKMDGTVQPIRLVCISENNLELVALQLLCIRIGWLFCPLNPRFTTAEITQRLLLLGKHVCWASPDSGHRLFSNIRINFTAHPQVKRAPLTGLNIDKKQPCSAILTSGSSGLPKAIVHHYANHYFSALGSQSTLPLKSDDHNLLSLPLFHIGGYATVIRSVIAGACMHLSSDLLQANLLQKRSITHLSLVSTQLIRLLDEPLFNPDACSIKHILLGGSAFSARLLAAVSARGFNYHLTYGCTEMASQVATSNNNNDLRILPYRQVKIKQGEIYLRGKTRFLGYLKDNQIIIISPRKWVPIGDNGYLDHHEKKFNREQTLTVLGRKDRQFISGGENIRPEEIERVCFQQRAVKAAYIYPIEDPLYGKRVVLFVDFFNLEHHSFKVQTQQLSVYLKSQLTRFKQPDHYLPWPKDTALKPSKKAFQAALRVQGLLPSSA